MGLKELFCGTGMNRMPDVAFRGMSFFFVISDLFFSPDKKLDRFGIRKGDTVIDYGCGPGRYVARAASLVGPGGVVYAADLHELAVKSVDRKIARLGLANVKACLIRDYSCPLENGIADVIYALDMFHMVSSPDVFLAELNRLMKKGGRLILEDGHQPRASTLCKVTQSGLWDVAGEAPGWLVCSPRKN